MLSEIVILKDGIPLFHHSYRKVAIENIDITGGFFQAIFYFSQELENMQLESINLGESIFHFKPKNDLIFILREEKGSMIPREQIVNIIDSLAEKFLSEYPNMLDKAFIDPTAFSAFTKTCDDILKRQTTRKGTPILLQIALNPFLIVPVDSKLIVSQDYQEIIYSLQNRLKKWVKYSSESSEGMKFFQKPITIFLSEIKLFACIFPFNREQFDKDPTHLLCFMFDEEEFFLFYQLMPLIHDKATQIFSALTEYIKKLDNEPRIEKRENIISQIQETIEIWGDLNRYITGLEISLLEEFYKSGITSEILTEEQMLLQLHKFFMRLGENLDKIFFAILTQQKILFVGKNQELVKQTLSALSVFYPQASVALWTDDLKESLLVGTHPNNLHQYDEKTTLIIDLDSNQIKGGEKNGFCAELSEKTKAMAQKAGIKKAREYFQNNITSIFTFIQLLLKVDITEEKGQEQLQKHLKEQSLPMVQLVDRMTQVFNYLIHSTTHEYFNSLLRDLSVNKELPEKIILAYCRVCDQILKIPIKAHSKGEFSSGGLWKYIYVHEEKNKRSHGLMLYLDKEFTIRHANIVNIALEALPPLEFFEIEAYCQLCQQKLKIPVDNLKFSLSIDSLEFYEQAFIHGFNPHTLMILIDKKKQVRRAELTDLDLVTSNELSKIIIQEGIYTSLHTCSLSPSTTIFEEVFIFNRVTKTVISFYTTKPYSMSMIAKYMEEKIKTLELTQKHTQPFFFSIENGKKCFGILSEANQICITGIGFDQSYVSWLEKLVTVIADTKESPHTLGLEIFFRLMEKHKQPIETSVLKDILYSPLYAIKFTFKYQELFDRVFSNLEQLFPNIVEKFRPCALGLRSLLEALNTETGLQWFNEFIELINYVERRGLF